MCNLVEKQIQYILISYFFSISLYRQNSIVYSVFCLIGVFIATAIGLFLNGVEFLSYVLIIVYVGAVSILFLFVVMLLGPAIEKKQQLQKVGLFGVPAFLWALLKTGTLFTVVQFFVKDSSSFGLKLPTSLNQLRSDALENDILYYSHDILKISKLLYVEHIVLFYLIALILLLSMIGAVVLCRNYFKSKN